MSEQRELSLDDFGVPGRVVVVAPHPDDEVFALGGLMAQLCAANSELEIVAVTDGEASHASSNLVTRERMRTVRFCETNKAYEELGISPRRFRLGLPDSDVQSHAEALSEMLAARFEGASVVFAPIETDGHPDHDATGRAAREVAEALGIRLWRFAVWARLHPERICQGTPRSISMSPEVLERKRRAMDCYASQFVALGPDREDGPVLPADFLQHFLGPKELLWTAR